MVLTMTQMGVETIGVKAVGNISMSIVHIMHFISILTEERTVTHFTAGHSAFLCSVLR